MQPADQASRRSRDQNTGRLSTPVPAPCGHPLRHAGAPSPRKLYQPNMAGSPPSAGAAIPGAKDRVERGALALGNRLSYYSDVQNHRRLSRDRVAVLVGLMAPLAMTVVLVPFRNGFANTDAALVLVLIVVAVAADGNRLAGMVAGLSSAVWFDFFLTSPYEHFSITRRSDIETTVLLLAISVAVTEIALWGRRQQAAATSRAAYLSGIHANAEAVMAGHSPSAAVAEVTGRLVELLSLRSCRFQAGIAGLGAPAQLQRDGQILLGSRAWDVAAQGLPPESDVELLVEAGDLLQGRFLMTSTAHARPTLEQRQVAVALADQLGVALARGVRRVA